jgi:hypothetical protein
MCRFDLDGGSGHVQVQVAGCRLQLKGSRESWAVAHLPHGR